MKHELTIHSMIIHSDWLSTDYPLIIHWLSTLNDYPLIIHSDYTRVDISTPYGWDGGSAQAPLQHFSIRG